MGDKLPCTLCHHQLLSQTCRYGGGTKESKGEEEGDEAGESKDGSDMDPDYGLSGKLTAETNTFRVRHARPLDGQALN